MERLERDYREARTRIEGEIKTLKSKVELLNNSGCPAPENATCRFLADALEAKEALPATEHTLVSLEEEYENGRQMNAEAVSVAERAFADKKHIPEEIEAMRASQRLLEAAEKDYNNLEALRRELALMARQ